MRHEKISIKWKIFLFLLAFIFILLAVLWTVQINYLDMVYKLIKTQEAESATRQAVTVLKSKDSDISSQIDDLAAKNNLAIYVTDQDGNPVYNAEYIPTSRLNTMPDTQFQIFYNTAKENGGSAKIEFKGSKNQTLPDTDPPDPNLTQVPKSDNSFMQNHGQQMAESVIFVNIIETDDGEAVLMVNSVLTPVTATVNTLKVELAVITVLMIILSLLLALLISRQFSKSIIRLNLSAKELAQGNFQIHFEGRDYREIAELSDTLNYAADELGRTENLRRELIANISHDLRTPLTMIIAYAEVMRDLPGENTPENVQVIIDESRRLTNLVNDMLDISKLQAGVQAITCLNYNLTESIQSVFERYNKLKEQDGYNIVFEYDAEAVICADEYKIFQVIYNLINNAVNYTGEDKTVIVRQLTAAHRVRIEISDSGEGIEKEALPYVWDRYYKVDKTHKRAIMGTGLGLSIVKNILDMHHATYGVDSEPGQGSTFWFELDRVYEETVTE